MKLIINLFNKWGLIVFFILIMLEYACFPLPSELLLPFLGFVISVNGYSVVGTIIMSSIMGYIGCLVCYLIGYYGGKLFYKKIYNKYKNVRKSLDYGRKKFEKYGKLSVMICRVIPLCRTYISFLAGLYKQSLFNYSFYSLIGICLWNSILIIGGYLLSNNYRVISFYYDKYKVFIIIFVIIFLVYKLYKKKKTSKTINGD